MQAPVGGNTGNEKVKNENIQLVPQGLHPAYIAGFIDLGTQFGYNNKLQRKIMFIFEIADHLQEYYIGDGQKPAHIYETYTFSMSSLGNLRALMSGLFGNMTDEQAAAFKFDQNLVGMMVYANVAIGTAKGSGKQFNKIMSLAPIPDVIKQTVPPMVTRPVYYSIGEHGFNSREYTEVPRHIRESQYSGINNSQEALEYVRGGGVFAEWKTFHDEDGNPVQGNAQIQQQPVTPQQFQQQQQQPVAPAQPNAIPNMNQQQAQVPPTPNQGQQIPNVQPPSEDFGGFEFGGEPNF